MPAFMDTAARIREVMAEILDVNPAVINETFSQDSAPSWDSLAHLRLITALEEAFGIRFTMKEVGEMSRYATIRERIAARQ
jgi:acyl carrier protein